jgi:Ca2+-binding RTX toxin-like protein
LAYSKNYYVTFANGAIKDIAGNNYAGTSTYDFTTGAAPSSAINGTSGNDTLTGTSNADVINGLAGNDTLNGGAGVDTLVGGLGNDTYLVDSTTDTITENASEGTDLVQSSVTFSLASILNVENLTLTGTIAINGTGNSLDNTLTGNTGVNILNGGDGNDFLFGGLGNDTLTGGAGVDHFVFNTTLNATSNKDTITDFVSGTDKIDLENSVMTALGLTTGTLASGQFWAGAGVVKGHDADDRIVYNTTTGALYYDADGLGNTAAIQIAMMGLSIYPTINYQDFLIV